MSLLQPIYTWRREGKNATPVDQHGEAATQTFKVGAPLVWNGVGYLAEAATNPTAIIGIATNPGHNFAAAGGAVATTEPNIPPSNLTGYVPAETGTIFAISVDKASGQGGASAVIAYALLGTTIGITKDATTGYWYADVDKEGGNQVATIVGFIDPPGTVNGRIMIKFLGADTAEG